MIGAAGTVSPRRSRIKEGWWEPRLPNLNREENSERNRSDRALWNKAPRSPSGAEANETTCDDCISGEGEQSL